MYNNQNSILIFNDVDGLLNKEKASRDKLLSIWENEITDYTFEDASSVDFETENDGCVTVRDRDTMEQIRLPISELVKYLTEKTFY